MRLLCTFDNLLCKLYHFQTHHYIPGNIICSEFYFDIKIDPQSFPRLIFEYIFHPFSLPISVFIFQEWPWDWKRSVCIPIPKKGNAKECSNYRTIALISHASPWDFPGKSAGAAAAAAHASNAQFSMPGFSNT